MSRAWAMPNAETFSIQPIGQLVRWWLRDARMVVDPFARNSRLGTITNDLNPETAADYHMDAADFCEMLVKRGVVADAVLFDPPYSPRQISECYQGVGRVVTMADTQMGPMLNRVRDFAYRMLRPNGVVISCGWNSQGFGLERGFEMQELLLVAHGGLHNDTIVTVECKREQPGLFGEAAVS